MKKPHYFCITNNTAGNQALITKYRNLKTAQKDVFLSNFWWRTTTQPFFMKKNDKNDENKWNNGKKQHLQNTKVSKTPVIFIIWQSH